MSYNIINIIKEYYNFYIILVLFNLSNSIFSFNLFSFIIYGKFYNTFSWGAVLICQLIFMIFQYLLIIIFKKIINIIDFKYTLFLDIGVCSLLLIFLNYINIWIFLLIRTIMHCINIVSVDKYNKNITISRKDRLIIAVFYILPFIAIFFIIFYFNLTIMFFKYINLKESINIIIYSLVTFIMKIKILNLNENINISKDEIKIEV
jgi:hypothetical protein